MCSTEKLYRKNNYLKDMSSFEPFLTQQKSLSLHFSKVISFLSKLDNFTVIEELSNYRSMLFELKNLLFRASRDYW